MKNAWKIWAAAATSLTVLYFAVEKSPESKLVLYNGVGFLSLVLLVFGGWKHRP